VRDPVDWPTRDPLAHRRTATPSRTALVDADRGREWTYRSLDGLVDATAARLADALGDRESPRVGTLVSTRPGFVRAFYAGLRLGGTVVPLNTRLAEPELRDRTGRVRPDLLVCGRETEQTALSVADCPVVSLDVPDSGSVAALPDADASAGGSGTDGESAVEPARWDSDGTAVVVFTSGTTGDPKGTRLTLGNLVASATASAFRLGVASGNRWLCCLPVYHMGGLAPVVRCPLYGTTLLVQREFDADTTAGALGDREATGVSLVPTQLRRLLDSGWRPPETLETVLLGGAPASRDLIQRALAAGVPVHPTYGLTETASQVATATPDGVAARPESVGQPLVFTEVTVVDADGRPVDGDATGELVVDGPTVTPGYLDDEATREAFGEHGLHTRDVGYRDADGRLWVLGRADDTILTGGENVHPREVTDVLEGYPGLADAAVVGLDDEEWGQRVGALVVATDDSVTAEDVRAFVRERLADYKVPKTVGFASELPRTASGTIDRGAVRDRLE